MAPPSGSEQSSAAPLSRRAGWHAPALVVAVLAAYANSFPGIFVFDDFSSVVDNPSLRRLWPLGPVLWPPLDAGVGGRPLANLSFALNFAISGLQPWSYHALNVVLHAANALLLYGCVRRTLARIDPTEPRSASTDRRAFAAALLWAVHPLATAVVDYVSQRTEALMACWSLLTLYAFLRSLDAPSRGWRILSVAACLLGAASKETMVVVPLLVLLYDRVFIAGSFRGACQARRSFYLGLGLSWVLLGALMLRSQLAARGVGFGLGVTWFEYGLTQCRALLHYLSRAIWPAELTFDHGWSFLHNLDSAAQYLSAVSLLIAVTLAWSWRRPKRLFVAAWVALLLAPTSSIIPIVHQPIAESRMYLPLAGLTTLLAVAGAHLLRGRTRLAGGLLGGLALSLLLATHLRNRDYRSEVALWTDTIAKQPANARAHGNLAAAWLRIGRSSEAAAAATVALQLRPDYPEARTNLGVALLRSGRSDDAINQFEAVLIVRPDFVDARYNLGEALVRAGRLADALKAFDTLVRLNPAHAAGHNNLGVVLLRLGRTDDAISHFETALRLAPAFAEARRNLEMARRR